MLSLIVTLALARYLSPVGFGELSYLIAMVTILSPLMAFGLNSIVTREVLIRPRDQRTIIGTAIALRGLSAFCVVPVAISLAFIFLDTNQATLLTVLILSSMFNAANVVDFWLQAHVASRFSAIIRFSSLSLFSFLRLLGISLQLDLSIFVYLFALEIIMHSVLYLLAYHRLSDGLNNLTGSMAESVSLFRDSRWLLVSGLAAIIYLKIDQVMIGYMIDQRSVGVYAVAARVSEVWYFIPAAVAASFFPGLIKQKKITKRAYQTELQKINDGLFCIAVAVAAAVVLFANEVLQLFGEAYTDSVQILVVHIWGGVFVFMRSLLSKWFIIENLLKLSMFSQVLGAVINVALNVCFIRVYGPLGAAYATVISHAVAGYLVLFCHRDLWPMAVVVTKSILLPIRLAQKGFGLYKT